MASVWIYLKERFPLPLVALLSLGFTLLLVGVSTRFSSELFVPSAFIFIAFAAFLLRLRATDEFKDSHHDNTHYPTRPLQRGVISRRLVALLGGFAACIELLAVVGASVALQNAMGGLWYALVVAYSLLTAVEFFCSAWLTKHFTVYFVTHQLIFVCFLAWAFFLFGAPITPYSLLGAAAVILLMSSVEIIRKLSVRHDSKGRVVKDTYAAVWGYGPTLGVLVVMLLVSGVLLAIFTSFVFPALIGALGASLVWLSGKRERMVQLTVALVFIIQGVGVYFT